MTKPSLAGEIARDEPTPRIYLLGIQVHMVQIPDVVRQMEQWITEGRRSRFIAVTGMHGLTEAQSDPSFKVVLNAADLVVPDGMPLVWLARWRGNRLKRRVYGPELMLTFCEATAGKGYRHFLYGGAPGVAEQLARVLTSRFPGLQIAGTYSPPYRPLTTGEGRRVVEIINNSRAEVLWVGLSSPKQERWMYEYRDLLHVPVMVGVGAAFDLNTGRVKQAPPWMREHGLEWFYRLLQEPGRLWRRYLIHGSRFVAYVILESFHLKKFD